jgi:hypothetical protein
MGSHIHVERSRTIVLEDKARAVPPVIEDLGAENVSSHAPDKVITLLSQPLVAKGLDIKVMYLKTRVVDVVLGSCLPLACPSVLITGVIHLPSKIKKV